MTGIIPAHMTVRQAGREDAALLANFIDESLRRSSTVASRQPFWASGVPDILSNEERGYEGGLFIAEVDGVTVGCSGWRGHQMDRAEVNGRAPYADVGQVASIRDFYLHPAWAGQGFGHHLLQLCAMAARRAGYQKIELMATVTEVDFYTATGFRPVEYVDLLLPTSVTVQSVKLQKEL